MIHRECDRGLSKLLLEAAFIRGSQVLDIIPEALKSLGYLTDQPIEEKLIVSSMEKKISKMLNHTDVFIFLPGYFAALKALLIFVS